MNQRQNLSIVVYLDKSWPNLEFFQDGFKKFEINIGLDHGHILVVKIKNVCKRGSGADVKLSPVCCNGLLTECKHCFQLRRNGHARQQIDNTVLQTLGTLGIGTGKILDVPLFFSCDLGEKVDRDPLCLAIRIGENQGGVLMNANDNPLRVGRSGNRRKQAEGEEIKEKPGSHGYDPNAFLSGRFYI